MASISTGLEYETAVHGSGPILTSTGAEMRARQSDQQGGTDAYDAAEAWESYGQTLTIRDGHTFDDARADLVGGRLVHLDVWAAACAGPCCDSECGHTIAVAPEQSGSRWLVADPWCSPAKWVWWDEALLREGAEAWGRMCYSEATSGMGDATPREAFLLALMRRAAKRLMTLHRPDAPATVRPPETSGSGGRIMFTTTHAPSQAEEGDMPINASAGLITNLRTAVPKGVEFYADPNLTKRLGSMSADADVVYVGNPIGESVEGGSRAIQVNTSTAYNDGSVRPTIVYVAADAVDPYSVPPPDDNDAAVIASRDEEWMEWLLEGAPGHDE